MRIFERERGGPPNRRNEHPGGQCSACPGSESLKQTRTDAALNSEESSKTSPTAAPSPSGGGRRGRLLEPPAAGPGYSKHALPLRPAAHKTASIREFRLDSRVVYELLIVGSSRFSLLLGSWLAILLFCFLLFALFIAPRIAPGSPLCKPRPLGDIRHFSMKGMRPISRLASH